ncbi:MAG: NAD(P)(+) transhydrogenase (Re/Si-specific) subunit beta [Candidatus Izemoplasmatales bacterium]|jgi:NAD(P) transhydrogenase subunit beta|nr:NAD(P)(+) transhydrogenase (Re/Si-specific) subunit beta [Candidatus Izemoplasmatales bacterium]MDD3865777.1 NAD(P)(+) transhydrogenase (Re/Si-specific) subunit beta [Candidatus Izemoplasmatales bacterium]
MNNCLFPVFLSIPAISDTVYYLIAAFLAIAVLFGIFLMSKVKKARLGNIISAIALTAGIVITLIRIELIPIWVLFICLGIGTVLGLLLALRVKMIEMPQMVGFLNGLGGLASAIVGAYALLGIGADLDMFSRVSATVALQVGTLTFFGSMIAAGKLHRILPQKPISLPKHQLWTGLSFGLCLVFIGLAFVNGISLVLLLVGSLIVAMIFGIVFTIKIGGADMPIAISLLNSLSGVAGAISGLAIGEVLLVAVGGIVGASGLFLTQIMCKAMNRTLFDILLGKSKKVVQDGKPKGEKPIIDEVIEAKIDVLTILKNAKNVIIVPGYGMAIAQAQHLVKQLADLLVKNGAQVRYAIHPVAGRMPGHMNVLLAEADVDYDDLYEMDTLNDDFKTADLTIVIGANDVMNPAAREAEGTPIYGMPILNVDQCKTIFIFNYDLKPGYAGVENPLYKRNNGVYMFLGNAANTLKTIVDDYTHK